MQATRLRPIVPGLHSFVRQTCLVNPTGLDFTERFDDLGGPTATSTWQAKNLDTYSAPATSIAQILYANIANGNLSMLIGARTASS